MRRLLLLPILAQLGCASLESQPIKVPAKPPPGESTALELSKGLVYHLPRADVLITVVVVADDKGAHSVTRVDIAAGPAYADARDGYLLSFERSQIGESVMNIGVTSDGLLTTADAATTPKIFEALQFVVDKAKAVAAAGTQADDEKKTCRAAGSHRFLVSIPRDDDTEPKHSFSNRKLSLRICGDELDVGVEEIFPAMETELKVLPPADARPGVYYRQSRPFRVKVSPRNAGFGLHAEQVVLSPTRSPLRFLPYERTFLGRNEVKLAFHEGQPQAFTQTTDGEVPALLKLPAAVLQAYFAAVGALFNGFSSRDKAEANAIGSEIQLELARQKLANCMAAAGKSPPDPELLKSLGCTGGS